MVLVFHGVGGTLRCFLIGLNQTRGTLLLWSHLDHSKSDCLFFFILAPIEVLVGK